jgi:hypothetical protein
MTNKGHKRQAYRPQEWREPMASIEIILRDDEGNIIGRKTRNDYALKVNKGRIGEIEEAVEEFKNESLADITYDLLAHSQQQEIKGIKKRKR